MVIIQNNVKAPKGEKIQVSYIKDDNVKYISTTKGDDMSMHYLYRVEGDKLIKMSKNKNPMEFEELIEY